MRIDLDLDLGDASRALTRLRRAGSGLAGLGAILGAHLEDSIAESFAQQASPAGAWAPLKPATIRERVRQGYRPGPTLQRTGDLALSITSRHGAGASGFGSGNFLAEAGTNLVYAATHQFGRGDIPARPFLALWPEHEQRIADDVRRWVLEAWRG